MKRHIGLLMTVLLLLAFVLPTAAQEEGPPRVGLRPDAPEYALHGPYWVGTMEMQAETPSHPTQVVVWYPAANPDGEVEDTTYHWFAPSMPILGSAIRDATPNVGDGPYPLLIVSHGYYDGPWLQHFLSEHLASHGFVVMAIAYVDNATNIGTVSTPEIFYTRPQDVSWQIDFGASLTGSGGALEGMIDIERVALVGHSFGGYTVLAAAGARLDLKHRDILMNEPGACIIPAELGGRNVCAEDIAPGLAAMANLDEVPDGLWPSWGDSRVDAVVALAPQGHLFVPDGLASVTVPTIIMGGTSDRFLSPNWSVRQPYDLLNSTTKALVTFSNAGHHLFSMECGDAAWLPREFSWWCSDPVWDMDRAHDLINHFTTAFLLDVLKGDTDAHAALAPDAVSFPGITYEAAGF